MNEQHIGIAARTDRQRLARADRDNAHNDAARFSEDRQDVLEKAGLFRRCRRGKRDEALFRAGSADASEHSSKPGKNGASAN
jgi:hypothetical protein